MSFYPPSYLKAQFCDFWLDEMRQSPVVVSHRLDAHEAPNLGCKTGDALRSAKFKPLRF